MCVYVTAPMCSACETYTTGFPSPTTVAENVTDDPEAVLIGDTMDTVAICPHTQQATVAANQSVMYLLFVFLSRLGWALDTEDLRRGHRHSALSLTSDSAVVRAAVCRMYTQEKVTDVPGSSSGNQKFRFMAWGI